MHKSTTLFTFAFCLFTFAVSLAQESKVAKIDTIQTTNSNLPNAPQVEEGDIKISDGTNTLIRITDEGTFGAIEIKTGVPSTTTDKLYNDGGTLKFDGSTLGGGSGATAINDLTDAKYDGRSLYLGENSGTNDDGSNDNVAVGKDALMSITSGRTNTASGVNALRNNTTGSANTAIGNNAISGSSAADSNTAIGWQALRHNSSGSSNTAIGTAALWKNTVGNNNTASGQNALYSNTIGNNNAALGENALKKNIDGDGNVGLGKSVLFNNTSGGGNVGVGLNSLYKNTTGSTNIALGQGSQYYNTTGSNNIGLGYRANLNNTTGKNNTIVGHDAGGGGGSHSKSGSVFLGHQAGYSETTDNKLYIENSNSSSPLVWGDFATDSIKINGNLNVSGNITTDIIYTVGDYAQGGYVIEVTPNGKHGLVVTLNDQVAANGGTGSNFDYAINSCTNESNHTANGANYKDWRIPTIREWGVIYSNQSAIDAMANSKGGTQFASSDNLYWTTQVYPFNTDQGYYIHMDTGNILNTGRLGLHSIRCVRAF